MWRQFTRLWYVTHFLGERELGSWIFRVEALCAVRPIMLGIMVGVTRRTVTVGIPQVQFSDLVVLPGVQRQAYGPDSAAPRVPTTSGTVGLRAEQIRLKEYVDKPSFLPPPPPPLPP